MFKNLFKREFIDLYRIKVVTLNSGINLYYPQYKDSNLGQFTTLILVNGKYPMVSCYIEDIFCDTKEEAESIINKHKEVIKNNRNSLIKETQIIEL